MLLNSPCCDISNMPPAPPCEVAPVHLTTLSFSDVYEAMIAGRLFYQGTKVESMEHLSKLHKERVQLIMENPFDHSL